MIWVLLLIALLIAALIYQVADDTRLGRRLHDSHMSKLHEQMHRIEQRLDEIERHTARSAEPFYDADRDTLAHPDRYAD